MRTISWPILFLTLVGCAAGASDRIVAYVDREIILESDVRERMAEAGVASDAALRDLIAEKVLLAEAGRQNITVEEEALRAEIESRRRSPDEASFLRELAAKGISYERFKQKVADGMRIRSLLRQKVGASAVVSTSEWMKAVQAERKNRSGKVFLLKGKDFADREEALAFRTGWQPTRESEMQDMGEIRESDLLPSVAEGVAKLRPGELSDPILLTRKYHVFLVKDVRNLDLSEEQLYETARRRVYEAKYQRLLQEYLTSLQEKSVIRIVEN